MNRLINILHTIFFYLALVVTFILGTTLASLLAIFSKNRQRVFQNAAKIWAKTMASISRITVKVEGLGNLPKNGNFLLASNHQSAADILILLAYLPIYFKFIAKSELFKIPIFGTYLKLAGYIPIDRHRTLKAHKTLYDTTKKIKSGDSILIFPEGTRTQDGSLGPFKRGSLFIAKQAGVPIVPIAISGSFDIMPRGTFTIHPSRVKLSFGEPVPVNEKDIDKTINRVRSKILSMLKDNF